MSDVGLSDTCPCDSGLAYRECCFLTEVTAPNELLRARGLVRLDEALKERIEGFTLSYFGDVTGDALDVLPPGLLELGGIEQLTEPWALYDWPVDGFPLGEWYQEKRGRRLKPNERAWLKAQLEASLAVWQVVDVELGRAVLLRNLLNDDERTVFDARAADALVPHDHVLARVVSHDGISVFSGLHPGLLGPLDADAIARECRRSLGVRRKKVPKYLLKDGETGLLLLDLWQQTLSSRSYGGGTRVRLENSDGDPVLITTDTFTVKKGKAEEVAHRLLALPGVEREQRFDDDGARIRVGDSPFGLVFLSEHDDPSDGPTLIGYGLLRKDRLVIETNSVERADVVKELVEEACEDLVRLLGRVHEDPLSEKATRETEQAPPARGALVQLKEQHYQRWPDLALPALGGKTPRDAVRAPAGRKKVEVLLREFEHREARLPEEQRIDFGFLRRELGLER